MVRHYFPQSANGEVATNSNFPPQSGGENTSSPVGGTMEYEDFVGMEYENNDDMDYESSVVIPDNWFDTDYKQRNLITINSSQVPSTQTDFPFLLNEISNSDFTVMKANGEDVRFTSVSGLTVFDVEIEEANNNSGDLISWSKIPSIDNGTQFYVYYNNPNASSAGTSTGVWSNYRAVYHLNQTVLGANSTKDSTVNALDGTPQNMVLGDLVTGKIDGAININVPAAASDEFIDVPTNSLLNPLLSEGWSMSAWVRYDSLLENMTILGKFNPAPPNDGWLFVKNPSDQLRLLFRGPTSTRFFTASVNTVPSGQLVHVATTKKPGANPTSSNGVKFYIDAVDAGLTVTADNFNEDITDTMNMAIGDLSEGASPTNVWHGIIDEVRISADVKSPDFITTEVNNQSAPSSFYTISAAETI